MFLIWITLIIFIFEIMQLSDDAFFKGVNAGFYWWKER